MSIAGVITDEREGLPSASGIDRLWHCSGSKAAEAGQPELPQRDVTEDGNLIHDARAKDDDSELEATQREISQNLKAMEEREFDNWRVECDVLDGAANIIREQRFWIRNPLTLELVASAKPDFVAMHRNHALIIDFKTGFKDQTSSEKDWQLRCQSIAVFQQFKIVHIRSGTAHSRLSSKFDSTDYDLWDLARVERELIHLLWRADQPDAPRVPGAWCRYCRAQSTCRELATYITLTSHALPIASGKPDQLAIIDRISKMTPDELKFVHEREAIAKVVFDSVEAAMKNLPEDVLASIGYKVSPGNNNKKIVDVPTAFARLADLLPERAQCIKLSRGKAAEILADRENISKKSAQEKVDNAIGDALRDKIGQPRLREL